MPKKTSIRPLFRTLFLSFGITLCLTVPARAVNHNPPPVWEVRANPWPTITISATATPTSAVVNASISLSWYSVSYTTSGGVYEKRDTSIPGSPWITATTGSIVGFLPDSYFGNVTYTGTSPVTISTTGRCTALIDGISLSQTIGATASAGITSAGTGTGDPGSGPGGDPGGDSGGGTVGGGDGTGGGTGGGSEDHSTDTDGDGLLDYDETHVYHTNPLLVDTDNDGMPDGWEVQWHFNPLDPDDALLDPDGDGLSNRLEYQFNSNPLAVDGDVASWNATTQTAIVASDGIPDINEIFLGLNPLTAADASLASVARSGLTNLQQFQDGGVDSDYDGLSDAAEAVWHTDPHNADTDGDGMPDAWEVSCGLNPLESADAGQDKDGDGLTNLQEYQMGLLPYDYDTDNDGLGDGWEVAQGFNPKSFREGLTAWWRFDSGGTIAGDSGSLLHDGLLRGNATLSYDGKIGGALSLDGKDAYVVIRPNADLDLDTTTSISLWFKPAEHSLSSRRQLFDKRNSYTLEVEPYAIGGTSLSNRLVLIWYLNGSAQFAKTSGALVAGQWNHIVLTVDRELGQIRFCLNGVLETTDDPRLTVPFDTSAWPLILGSQRVLPISRTPEGLMDDVRIYNRALTAAEIAALSHPDDPSLEPNQDRDGDGLTELEEYTAGSNPMVADTDGDGLSDYDEVHVYNTDPRLADTDGDGLSDYDEVHLYHTDPRLQDTDGDTLGDYDEVMVYHTSSATTHLTNIVDKDGFSQPDGWDTDGDGMPDGWEVYYQLNPLSATDKLQDPDGDGITNLAEYQQDKHPRYPDDISTAIDSDGDGLSDWQEKYIYHTDPHNADTIGDGLGDLYRVTTGLIKADGTIQGNANYAAAADADGDGTSNAVEAQHNTSPTDPSNLSASAFAAIPIILKPDVGEIAYDAAAPAPVKHRGSVIALSYSPGDSVSVQESLASNRLIAAMDRISVEDPSGTVASQSLGTGGSPKGDPYEKIGSDASAGYDYRGGYDITGFVSQLPVDASGLVHFQIVGEVDPLFQRLPDPNPPSGGGDGGDGGGDGGSGGGDGGGDGGSGGGGGPVGFYLGYEYGNGAGGANQPGLYGWKPPSKPTYAASAMMAFVNNRLDLAVSHAYKPEEYLTEADEDGLGAIASLATQDENNVVTPPVKKSKLRVGKGPAITAKQVLTWDDTKLVVLDGSTVLTSPKEFTGNEVRNLEVYGNVNASGVVTVSLEGRKADDTALPGITPDTVKVVLAPMELAVDADRDGTIRLSAEDATDATSSDKPYRFWSNDDIDRGHTVDGNDFEEDDIGGAEAANLHPDWQANFVQYKRDLEDFFRLQIYTAGLNDAFRTGQLYIGLKWTDVSSGAPAIKLYQHVETDGGTKYLTDETVAQQQISGNLAIQDVRDTALGQNSTRNVVSGTDVFILPAWVFGSLSEAAPKTHLLAESCAAGKGQLKIVILKRDGDNYAELGDGPGAWFEFKKVDDFYERWTVGDTSGGNPSASAIRQKVTLSSDGNAIGYTPGFSYAANAPEENKYILYVHGWNMQPWEKNRFAETAFKRLYWQGYKGRFGVFCWPTTYSFEPPLSAILDGTSYDRGEWAAWKSATPLKALLADLNGNYGGKVYVMAHSMGNIVTGEALRLASQEGAGQIVNTYVASQAAVPANCYDGARSDDIAPVFSFTTGIGRDFDGSTFPQTANVYPDWLAGNGAAAGTRINFYNENDYALWHDVWELNQFFKPDRDPHEYTYLDDITQPSTATGFGWIRTDGTVDQMDRILWSGDHSHYWRVAVLNLGSASSVQDRYEIMAYASESRSKAVGAVNGQLTMNRAVNLQSIWPADNQSVKLHSGLNYSAHRWHSAQFRSTNMRQKGYWQALLGDQGFDITTP